MVQTYTSRWGLVLFRGILAVVFGLLAFFFPAVILGFFVFLAGLFFIIDGISVFVLGLGSGADNRKPSGPLIIEGIIGVLIGLLFFIVPRISILAVALLFVVWFIAIGILRVIAAVRLRRQINNEWVLIIGGVASILVGLLLLFSPIIGILVLIQLIGIYVFIVGIFLIIFAFRVRNYQNKPEEQRKNEPPPTPITPVSP